ncbi:tetratricopeptide repeat protein [Cupriavidus sp. AU9028]|uniref:tetratricopeptide repeat protein n=1 Tax=Cupriavidus sp. AU9028 TaxID=2871157 RepID=UPI001C941E25|nr:tetratricopeptide repeat protein [Cupriavidus sp. AU9028]MBY4896194.1 tetratricopeptide repeat protein [Cupriavidus sp. AU9028]
MRRLPVAVLSLMMAGAALLTACQGSASAAARTANETAPAASGMPAQPGTATTTATASKRHRAALHAELAAGYLHAGQAGIARDEAMRATGLDAGLASGWHVLALAELALGRAADAERSFAAALAAAPAPDGDLLNNHGWMLCQQGRYDEAMPQLRRALTLPSEDGAGHRLATMGACQLRQGDASAARASFGEALRLVPDHGPAAMGLARLYLHDGDLRAAASVLDAVNKGQRASAASLWLAARIAHRQGDAAIQADLIGRLRERFPHARELTAYEQGAWDE